MSDHHALDSVLGAAPASAPSPATPVRWSGMTHRGKIRANNEDAFLALSVDAEGARHLGKTGESTFERSDFLFAVSDGMGGANSGEFASRIAVDKITRLLPKSFKLGASGLAQGFADILSAGGCLFEQERQVRLPQTANRGDFHLF